MGAYHPNLFALTRTGRRLWSYTSYAAAVRERRSNEDLYLWLSNGVRQIAPLIDTQSEWDSFYQQYEQGRWLEYRVYVVVKEEVHGSQ